MKIGEIATAARDLFFAVGQKTGACAVFARGFIFSGAARRFAGARLKAPSGSYLWPKKIF